MRRKKLVVLPVLYDCGGDIEKRWYVYYSVRNPQNDKLVMFKVYDRLKSINNEKARRKFGNDICNEFAQKLKLGWSPFDDDLKVIYEDQMGYNKITRIYGKKRVQILQSSFQLFLQG